MVVTLAAAFKAVLSISFFFRSIWAFSKATSFGFALLQSTLVHTTRVILSYNLVRRYIL
ncbi:hypothetical protein GIB67_042691 [Kingdonia uniflora]|uniref:Uncharacterized protein n=1 Tax=Kingdonia uniflora TaxID=39325 RepID=A0A7J7NDN4_9MAGN|nr:hypothetical protein GIB67_042691 [Kingdonia uniflora]